MKGISTWEPYASLIQTRAKKIETRGWPTKYRGPLVICASKRGLLRHELNELMKDQHFKVNLQCSSCHGSGLDEGEEEDCEECEGTGEYFLSVTVTWTTIKAIYKKAVELLGR